MSAAAPSLRSSLTPLTFAAFFAVYVIWGSTYLGIRIGVESWPPLMMAGLRFVVAGTILLAVLRLMGHPWPTRREWGGAAILGVLMPALGNGLVTVAEKDVSSGVAALVIATVPLFTVLFSRAFGHKVRGVEWLSIALGLAGIALLNLGANLSASPAGALLLVTAAASWAFGSAWSRRLPLPAGPMASACEMLAGGVALLVGSRAMGEQLTAAPSLSGWLALGYLIVFGSIIAYSAYQYLLGHVRPAAATSYAYVNPAIAVALGVMFAGEHIGTPEMMAMAVIIGSVALLGFKSR